MMDGIWQGGQFVLQSTIEERIAKLEAERDKLEARVQEISEMCDIEYRHKVAFMARTTELEAERDALRDEVAQCAGYDDWAEYAALQEAKP